MYRATRKLIKERERFCSQFKPNLIKMHWVGDGEPHRCFDNSMAAKRKDVNKSGSTENPIRSGWMVHAYNRNYANTEIIQHWWNYDPKLKLHFDTTPLALDIKASSLEFIEDQELYEFGKAIINEIKTHVGKNLVYMNEKWYASEITSVNFQLKLSELKDLSHRNILYLKS